MIRELRFSISALLWISIFAGVASLLHTVIAGASGSTYSSERRTTSVTGTTATLTFTDDIVLVSNPATVTISLPVCAPGPYSDKVYSIKKTGDGNVLIDPNASETIDGAATKTIATKWSSLDIICTADQTAWFIN